MKVRECFQTAASLINKDSITNNIQDVAQEKAFYYREKAKLQKQIVEYISTMKKKDGSEYKASSVKQAVDTLNRHLLHHSSIPHINLHDKYMFSDLHDVLHGKLHYLQEYGFGEHYNLKVDQFKSDGHNGLQFFRYISKHNQRGINGGEAQIISIPDDNNADENFYLQPNPYWITGSWYRTAHVRKNRLNKFMQNIGCETQIDIPIELLSNHFEHKTATQILQD
ncbi:hypothetical protein C1645_812595 [Glomus cerebriforme]|uniref:Uncharacterized protein n=1 Tax=Glomus cerebriforme TaxID=658196 RepID=A0A397TPS3_9GLOM|nr:hypothetical protein C1645_812595 [Glomus cerebriforme]